MLSSTTCVGLRYGLYIADVSEPFLGSLFASLSPRLRRLSVLSPEGFNVLIRQYADTPKLRPFFTLYTGTGILTSFPLTSPFGYALGPD